MIQSILAVSPVAEAGGAENLLVDVLTGIRDRGVDVAIVIHGEGPLQALAVSRDLEVHAAPALTFRNPRAVAASARAVRRAVALTRPDVVLASHPKGQLICRLATLGRRCAHATQLYDPPDPRSPSTRMSARLGGTRFSITEETAEAYRARWPATDPIVIPPCVDGRRLRDDASRGDPDRVWKAHGLDGAGPRVVMVARLQRFKGPFDFLAMAEQVVRQWAGARFLLIGPDSPIEPDLRKELRASLAGRGLEGVAALAGRLDDAAMAATVAGATLLVHPAHREPFGLVVAEALALGTPVVAYDAAGPASILGRGGGVTVPVGQVDALAGAVSAALADDSLLDRWRASGAGVAAGLDPAPTVARYLDHLGHLVGPTGPPRPVTTLGAAPAGHSGVRDYGEVLAAELRRIGVDSSTRWVANTGDHALQAIRATAELLGAAWRVTPSGPVVWHYSPVAHGYRGLPGPAVLLGLVLRARGCGVVTILHELAYTHRPGVDGVGGRLRSAAQRLALRAVLGGTTVAVVTTTRRADWLKTFTKDQGPPVEIIPVFPTIPVVASPRGPCGDSFVIGVPGYVGDGVRPDLLLDAVRALGAAGASGVEGGVRVVLLGAPGPDHPAGRRWVELAAARGVAGALEFTGPTTARQLSQSYSACSVIALVNEEGPSSRKTTLAAALAHGLPVVSLDGGNRWDEAIRAGALLVVPPGAAALAAELARLRDAPSAREALGRAARTFAELHLAPAKAAETVARLLEGVEPAFAQTRSDQGRGAADGNHLEVADGRGAG